VCGVSGPAGPAGSGLRPEGPGEARPLVDDGPGTGAPAAADGSRRLSTRRSLRGLLSLDFPRSRRRGTQRTRGTPTAIHAQILSDVPPLDRLANHQALDDDTLARERMGEITHAELRALRLPWVTAAPCRTWTRHTSASVPRQRCPTGSRHRLLPNCSTTRKAASAPRWLCTPETRSISTPPSASTEPTARTRDNTVRRTIATHPRLPAEDLTRLLADPSESVAATAAANPNRRGPGIPNPRAPGVTRCAAYGCAQSSR
jgi:hypothetical protein